MAQENNPATDQHRIEAALKGVTRDLNSRQQAPQSTSPPRHHNEGAPRFIDLTNKLYDAAIEAGRRQVMRAESLLREIEAEAEAQRAQAKTRWEQLQRLERDLEDMSSELLQSFQRYNGDKK
jgi:dsDNA-specific endonuclease/ATPase MutS2